MRAQRQSRPFCVSITQPASLKLGRVGRRSTSSVGMPRSMAPQAVVPPAIDVDRPRVPELVESSLDLGGLLLFDGGAVERARSSPPPPNRRSRRIRPLGGDPTRDQDTDDRQHRHRRATIAHPDVLADEDGEHVEHDDHQDQPARRQQSEAPIAAISGVRRASRSALRQDLTGDQHARRRSARAAETHDQRTIRRGRSDMAADYPRCGVRDRERRAAGQSSVLGVSSGSVSGSSSPGRSSKSPAAGSRRRGRPRCRPRARSR